MYLVAKDRLPTREACFEPSASIPGCKVPAMGSVGVFGGAALLPAPVAWRLQIFGARTSNFIHALAKGDYLHRAHTARAPRNVLDPTMGKRSFLGSLVT